MMENFFFPLNSVSDTWLSPSSTTWATGMILAFVCGLGLYLLLMPFLQNNPPSPQAGKEKTLRKHQEKWGQKKNRMKPGILKVTRDCLRKLEETQNLVLTLESHLEKHCDTEGLHELLHGGDTTSEVLRTGLVIDHQTPRHIVENPSPNTSPLPNEAPLTMGSPLSEEHQEDQYEVKRIPLGTVLQTSPPDTSHLTSLVRNISGLDCCKSPISFLFWWWPTTKALLFPTWAHTKHHQECLFPQPHKNSSRDPTLWQAEVGRSSFMKQNVQKLLETLITKRAELKLWENKDKKGSLSQSMGPDYPLDIPGNILQSKGSKTDTGPDPFWTMKGKVQKLPSSQQLSYSINLGNIVQEKRVQLFWGLPSLHSESLVATTWIRMRASTALPKAVVFNTVSNSLPVQHQADGSPQPSQAEQVPQEVVQTQLWTQTLSPSVAKVYAEAKFLCSLPNQPPSPPSHIRSCTINCPISQHMTPLFIPKEDQNLEWPWKKQLKWKKALAFKFQKSQEAINQPTLNHPQGIQHTHTNKSTSKLPGDPKSPEFKDHKEQQQSQERVIRDEQQYFPPIRPLASQELKQHKNKFPGKCQYQAKGKHRNFQPTKPSVIACERSKGIEKVGSMYSGRPSKKGVVPSKLHKQELRRDPGDLPWSSGSPSCKGLIENSERYLVRSGKRHSGTHLSINPVKEHLKKALQVHLCRKLELMKEGMIPVCVRKSWLAASHALPKSSTQAKHINQGSLKGQLSRVNTSQELSFLDPKTHLMLETNIIRHRVRHRWDSHKQALESINIHLSEVPALPLQQPAIPASDDYAAKFANFQELPQKVLREKATLQSTFLAHAPAELQRAETATTSGDRHVLAEAHLYGQVDSMPFQSSTYDFQSSIQQSWNVLGTRRGRLETSPSPLMSRNDPQEERANGAAGGPSLRLILLEIQTGSLSSIADKPKEVLQAEKMLPPPWELTIGTSMMENSQIINLDLHNSELPGTRNSSCHCRFSFSQDLANEGLEEQVVVPGIHSGCHVNMFPATERPCSQSSLSSSMCISSKKMVTMQGPCYSFIEGAHRLDQQEPRLTRVRVTGKNNRRLGNPDEREGCGRLSQGQHEESSAAVRPSQAQGLGSLAEVRKTVTTRNKCSPCLPEKTQAPPERHVNRRIKKFLHCLKLNTTGKGQEDSQQKVEHPSSSTQSQGSVTRRHFMDGGEAEAQALTDVVEQNIVDKQGIQQGSGPSEMHWCKEEPQALMGRHYYPNSPCNPQPSGVMRQTCRGHQDNHKGRSHPMKSRWTTNKGRVERGAKEPMSLPSTSKHWPGGAGT